MAAAGSACSLDVQVVLAMQVHQGPSAQSMLHRGRVVRLNCRQGGREASQRAGSRGSEGQKGATRHGAKQRAVNTTGAGGGLACTGLLPPASPASLMLHAPACVPFRLPPGHQHTFNACMAWWGDCRGGSPIVCSPFSRRMLAS